MNVILPRSERLETVEDKLNEVIKQLSSQREKYQNDLGELSEKNLELAKKLESLISERQELIRTTEEKEKSLRTLERQQFETEKKLRNVEGQLSVEVQRTKKAIESKIFWNKFFKMFYDFENLFLFTMKFYLFYDEKFTF
jgi:DNA repair exonuclease SbcCD ATPase subunit